jgi:AcrR family transcriptional regulator
VTSLPPDFVVVRTRARPMSPDARRSHIIDSLIPLLQQHGREVSTRQIAEAAGLAEGTLFRVFADKQEMIDAAIARALDPQPFRDALRGIDPDDPTVDKITQVVQLLRDRFRGVIGFMSALGVQGRPPGAQEPAQQQEWLDILGQVFRPGELTVAPDVFGLYVRLLAFATAVPPFNAPRQFDVDELVGLITRGVLPPDSAPSATTGSSTSGKKD